MEHDISSAKRFKLPGQLREFSIQEILSPPDLVVFWLSQRWSEHLARNQRLITDVSLKGYSLVVLSAETPSSILENRAYGRLVTSVTGQSDFIKYDLFSTALVPANAVEIELEKEFSVINSCIMRSKKKGVETFHWRSTQDIEVCLRNHLP